MVDSLNAGLPKYLVVVDDLRQKIQRGELLPDQQLPNEDILAAQYNVSRGTLRKAIEILQHDGLVRKEHGNGTFISAPRPTLGSFAIIDFDQMARARNRQPATRTLTFADVNANARQAERLQVKIGDPLIHIVQLRLMDHMTVAYEERYLPRALCPSLTHEDVLTHPVHWLLVERYQIPLARLSLNIEPGMLPRPYFEAFQVSGAVPVFLVERLSFTERRGELIPAVDYSAIYRADEYYFEAQFKMSV